MPKLHPLARIELDGMKPVSRVNWLWRVNREWHGGRGQRRDGSRIQGSYYSTPTRHKRGDVLADGVTVRVIRPSSRPTGRSTAIRRLQAVTRAVKAGKPESTPGTYAHHVRTCGVCATGKHCEHARERFGV